MLEQPQFSLRPARAEDDPVIHRLIRQEHLNPQGIVWPRFIVAVDHQENVIGCGQVKLHRDGVRELASLVVRVDWRGKGVAGALINHLIAQHPGDLYLTCRAKLEAFYQRYGFVSLPPNEMPANYRRIYRLINGFFALFGQREVFKVMRRVP